MRKSINGVADINELITATKKFITAIKEEADMSGDAKGYVVKRIQNQKIDGVMEFPLINDEIIQLYDELYPIILEETI